MLLLAPFGRSAAIIEIECMSLFLYMFCALLRAHNHSNPRLAAGAKMSLSWNQNIIYARELKLYCVFDEEI